MLGYCLDVVEPGIHCLFGIDGGAANGTEYHLGKGGVERVAVAQAEPGLHAASGEIVYNIIKPRKVIHAFFFFGSLPARLQADFFDADARDLIIGLFGIEYGAVELFKADTDLGKGNIKRIFLRELSCVDESFHIVFLSVKVSLI